VTDWRDGDVVCTVHGVRVGVVKHADFEADRMEMLCLGSPQLMIFRMSEMDPRQFAPLRQLQKEHRELLDAIEEHDVRPPWGIPVRP
jgi:hypothetical protein